MLDTSTREAPGPGQEETRARVLCPHHARVPAKLLRRVVDQARLAPSIHNTQPWTWRVEAPVLELWADPARALPATDPSGRSLLISCGAALHHAVVAGQAFGYAVEVEHLPDPGKPDLVARMSFRAGRRHDGDERYLEAIRERCTDRRRFTSWPVPHERLLDLAEAGRRWGASIVPVTDTALRFRVEMLIDEAVHTQLHDEAVVAEEQLWLDRGRHDGMPRAVVPPLTGLDGERRARLAAQAVAEPPSRRLGEATDGLLAVCTTDDGPLAWLHAGETLSAVWLRATLTGLSLVPLSQVVEVPATRSELDTLVLRGNGHTQVLARIGWQEIGRGSLRRTPRRRLQDVLRTGPGRTGTKDHPEP